MLSILDMGYIARFRRGIRPSGHAMSVFEVKFEVDAGLRFCRGRRLDPLRTRLARRVRSFSQGGAFCFGVQILRSAATIVASSMMTVPGVIRGAASREGGCASATSVVSIRFEQDSRGGSRLAGSAPLGGNMSGARDRRIRTPRRETFVLPRRCVLFWGADPPICRDDRGVFDDDRAGGHSRSGFSRGRLRFCRRRPLDPLQRDSRGGSRLAGSALLGGRRSFSQGGAFSLGVQILRSAATIVASSMMNVPGVIRGAASRKGGFASATSVVSIRFERDSRGGSEDPRPSAGT